METGGALMEGDVLPLLFAQAAAGTLIGSEVQGHLNHHRI